MPPNLSVEAPNSPAELHLQVDGVSKSFGTSKVVDHLSFQIAPGECLGVIGPNGAGKTTTLRMCLGLSQPDSGTISAFGRPLRTEALQVKARIGVVGQMDTLDPDFSCSENLRVYGRYFGIPKPILESRITTLLNFAALTHKADIKPGGLSGGMRRRLSLARALINAPDLLMLDEPTTGLDPQARHLIWERLGHLLQQGTSILLTTHFMDEAERLCHRLIVLDKGQKIAEGTPRDLIAAHLEPHVVEVYGESSRAGSSADGNDGAAEAGGEAGGYAWATPALRALAERVEVSGATAFFYAHDVDPLLRALSAMSSTHGIRGVRSLHRPANLEDLFLKLTGRQIRSDS